MRFLLDDNLPYSLKVWLEDRGGGALKLFEVGLAGADDEEVYQYALENRFAVITLDLDFGYLFLKFRKGTIIVLRPSKATPSKIINLVKKCMAEIKGKEGLIIVRPGKIRVIKPD